MHTIRMNDLAPLSVEDPMLEQLSDYTAMLELIIKARCRVSRLVLHARSGIVQPCSITGELVTLRAEIETIQAQAEAIGRSL